MEHRCGIVQKPGYYFRKANDGCNRATGKRRKRPLESAILKRKSQPHWIGRVVGEPAKNGFGTAKETNAQGLTFGDPPPD